MERMIWGWMRFLYDYLATFCEGVADRFCSEREITWKCKMIGDGGLKGLGEENRMQIETCGCRWNFLFDTMSYQIAWDSWVSL